MTATPRAVSMLPAEVAAWAATPGGQEVLLGARKLLEAGHGGPRTSITAALNPATRRDVGRMLGLPWQVTQRPVTLGQLRAVLEHAGTSVEDVLLVIGGPLRDRPAERAAAAALSQARTDATRTTLLDAGLAPVVVDLLITRRWLKGNGVVGDLATLIVDLRVRPPEGKLLAPLANELYGDSHALDDSKALGRAAVRTVAATAALEAGASAEDVSAAALGATANAAGWRAAWAGASVTCDQLSSTVLVLNLPLARCGAAGAMLRAGAELAEPVWITARSLLGVHAGNVGDLRNLVVRVCENPAIVESAADQLGAACGPLVCTYGRPSSAAWTLLETLAGAGAQVFVTADRDVAGHSIVAELMRRLPGAKPWLEKATGTYEEERLGALLADLQTGR